MVSLGKERLTVGKHSMLVKGFASLKLSVKTINPFAKPLKN